MPPLTPHVERSLGVTKGISMLRPSEIAYNQFYQAGMRWASWFSGQARRKLSFSSKASGCQRDSTSLIPWFPAIAWAWGRGWESENGQIKKGLTIMANPLILLVAGRGFEPLTFGLWAQRATGLLHPASFRHFEFVHLEHCLRKVKSFFIVFVLWQWYWRPLSDSPYPWG